MLSLLVVGDIVLPSIISSEYGESIFIRVKCLNWLQGMDSQISYINEHEDFPESQEKKNILRNVYVRFIVTKNGSIVEPGIIKSVYESMNFDGLV